MPNMTTHSPKSASALGWRERSRIRAAARAQFMRREIIDTDQMRHLGIVVAQDGRFGLAQYAELQGLRNLSRQIQGGNPPGLDTGHANALFERLRQGRENQRLLQHAEWIVRPLSLVNMLGQTFPRGGRIHDQIDDVAPEPIAGRKIGQPTREYEQPHEYGQRTIRGIAKEQ